MAKREVITISEIKVRGFNVTDSVGHGGVNRKADVLLVQAMFQYLGELIGSERLGFQSAEDLPAVTGRIDAKTLSAIRTYQQNALWTLYQADGVIHPAVYHNRNIKLSRSRRLMTITCLHLQTYLEKPPYLDYTEEILLRFPQLRQCIAAPSREIIRSYVR